MIQHVPEGIVPFEYCGYARTPKYPFVGQEIELNCVCDHEMPPRLELDEYQGEAPAATSCGNGLWSFTLPAFSTPKSLRYRFVSEQEKSSWFSLDVMEKISVSAPEETGEGWIKLKDHIYLTFAVSDSVFAVSVENHKSVHPLCLPDSWKMETGSHQVWGLVNGENKKLLCRKITLGLREDHSVAWQEMLLEGTHQHVWGTGERFDFVDQMGHETCGQVVEHFTQQKQWTYIPVPFFMTDSGYGFFRNAGSNVVMAFDDTIRISSLAGPGMKDSWLLGTPAEQLSAFLHMTGEPKLPPEWAFGLWISANGWCCDDDVEEQLNALKKYDCPASVMVLEAWSDESTFYRWSDKWDNPREMISKVREAGLHLVLWQIPVLKALKDSPDQDAVRCDREEAISNGWIVRHTDGSPYEISEKWFAGSLLPDFTNPAACEWWFSKRDHLLSAGVEGFKTDGGEFLFGSDIVLYDGTNGIDAHNLYPMQYVQAYHDWMKKRGIEGITFSRAGYTGAQMVPTHWAGDQLSTWQELQAQLAAGISAGLSGILFWGFDIGGFAGELPDKELYLRATAFACFSPIMQWHAEPRNGQFYATHDQAYNNDRSPWNLAEKLGDPDIIRIACSFARHREQLRSYLWEEAQYCVHNARPMMAHLCLDYFMDHNAVNCNNQYMLGRKYMVAPITEKGSCGREVYFPEGDWKHYFTREIIHGGTTRYFGCPLEEALVFEKMENRLNTASLTDDECGGSYA